MRYLLIIAAVLALAGTAQAAPPTTAGAPAKLTITPKRVDAGERFTLSARGFTPGASVTILFAITGQAPYASYTPPTVIAADGSYSLPFVFETCGNSPDNLTITLVDALGVSASARLVLC
jgi:hypothetical protein